MKKVWTLQELCDICLHCERRCNNEEKLTATLTEEQKETFEKYKDCNREIYEICEKDAFLNGFRLGARIIIESVNE